MSATIDSGKVRRKQAASYITKEKRLARRHDSPVPYFRLEDPLCKGFLELATDPQEFEGMKLLFPFVREMSLLRFERSKRKLPAWM